jgi:hypothetical protein
LIPTFEKVLETREQICNWIGENLDLPEYLDLARRLSVDMKLRKVRGTIYDTRIFIDEIRFNLWAEENLKGSLSRLNHEEMVDEDFLTNLTAVIQNDPDAATLKSGLGINYWLFQVCQAAFSEFCTNKIFGITSYLGRRIRHGTLEGFMMTPIVALFDLPKYRALRKIGGFETNRQKWLSEYRSQVFKMRDEYLHFKTDEKRHGLFFESIFSSTDKIKTFVSYAQAVKAHLPESKKLEN